MSSFLDDLIAAANSELQAAPHIAYDTDFVFIPINDTKHLENHLNYLFRTDASQKWTNNLTDENVYIFPTQDGCEILSANTYQERTSLRQRVKDKLKELAKRYDLPLTKFVTSIMQIRSDYYSSATRFNSKVEIDTRNLFTIISQLDADAEVVCAVVHVDQTDCYLHLHALLAPIDTSKYQETVHVDIQY